MNYLEGNHIDININNLKLFIGCKILFLLECSIDKLGNSGIWFPYTSTIIEIYKDYIGLESGDFVPISEFREIILSN